MTKAQKVCIEEELTNALHRIERLEKRLDEAEAAGHEERVKEYETRLLYYRNYLAGADRVLCCLGFVRKHHEEDGNGYYTLEKI